MEALLGGVPQLAQVGSEQGLKIGAELQDAEYERDMAVAQNAQGIEGRRVARLADLENSRLQGAQAASAQSSMNMQNAIAGGLGALGFGYQEYLKQKALYAGDKTDSPLKTQTTLAENKTTSPLVKKDVNNEEFLMENDFLPMGYKKGK
jgi:hypothetical protein